MRGNEKVPVCVMHKQTLIFRLGCVYVLFYLPQFWEPFEQGSRVRGALFVSADSL